MSDPLISIIVATYNRSNVLAMAIRTVCWQTRTDWELIVVGDACTDDTEQVVVRAGRAIGVDAMCGVGDLSSPCSSTARADCQCEILPPRQLPVRLAPRIRFVNLDQNVGEQSGPNNVGFQLARGRYIAYLNHDDLWLPDHLETLVSAIDQTGADLVFSVIDLVQPAGPNRLSRLEPVTRHAPPVHIPASCWLARRELIEELGGWRFYQECLTTPSRDFLFRAWRAGKRLQSVLRLTVVAIPSGRRIGSYSHRRVEEHQVYFDRLSREADFRERELASLGFDDEESALRHRIRERAWWRQLRPLHSLPWRVARGCVERLCVAAKVDPLGGWWLLRYQRKGGFIDQLRRQRGLPELKRRCQTSQGR